jgi:hypothetical protein
MAFYSVKTAKCPFEVTRIHAAWRHAIRHQRYFNGVERTLAQGPATGKLVYVP